MSRPSNNLRVLGVAGGLVFGALTIGAVGQTIPAGGIVPLATSAVAGKMKCDGVTTTCAADGTVTATAGGTAGINQLTGDVTAGPAAGAAAATLATVNSGSGVVGSSTAIPVLTTNGKGLVTAQTTAAVVAPAGTLTGATLAAGVTASSLTSVGTLVGGATGAGFTVNFGTSTISGVLGATNGGTGLSALGTGIATALGINVGSAGAPVLFNGAGGTPSSLVLTNATALPLAGMANLAANSIIGNNTGAPATPIALTAAQVKTLLAITTANVTGPTGGGAQCLHVDNAGAITGTGSDCGSGGGGTPANPTATAGPTAVNGVATTYMRSDAAPAVQAGSNSQQGLLQCDGLTIVCPSGTVGNAGTVVAGTTQTITAAQWAAGDIFGVTTAAQTLTLPLASTLAASGTIAIQTIGQTVTLAPNAADAINGGTAGVSINIPSGLFAVVTRGAAANSLNVSPTVAGTVTSIATTGPITGGTITGAGTIACATCTTSAAALTANQIVIGSGAQAMATLGSLGTTTTVLHGNAGGAPSFGAVAIGTDVSGLGTGVGTALGVNVGSAGAPVVFNGALGTPSSGTLTNATGLPVAGITGLGTGVGTALGTAVSGSGAICLATGSACAGGSGSGSLVLIATRTAANSTELDFGEGQTEGSLGSTYDTYELKCSQLKPGTANSYVYLQFGEDNTGSVAWKTANYASIANYAAENGAGSVNSNNADATLANNVGVFTVWSLGTTRTTAFRADLNLQTTEIHRSVTFSGAFSPGTDDYYANGGGTYSGDQTAITGVRVVLYDVKNGTLQTGAAALVSGKCSLYGVTP